MILFCSACETIRDVHPLPDNGSTIILTCGHIAHWNDDTATWDV